MSTNLYYDIAIDSKYLGKDLKYEIAPFIWGHDGSLSSEQTLIDKNTSFYNDGDEIVLYQFLKGLARGNDDKAKEAKKLIGLIDRYGQIFISLQG